MVDFLPLPSIEIHGHTYVPIYVLYDSDVFANNFLVFPNHSHMIADIENDICTAMRRAEGHIISVYL